jgi:hypothetical protein
MKKLHQQATSQSGVQSKTIFLAMLKAQAESERHEREYVRREIEDAVETTGLQPGQLVAAARAAEKNRQLVVDELAAAAGENRRTPNQAHPPSLAAAGGESPDSAAVWEHAAEDCRAAITGKIEER